MDRVLQFDRRIVVALARWVAGLEKASGRRWHDVLFWSAAGAHLGVWLLLCWLSRQPDWLWVVFATAVGAVTTWLVDHEPVALVEEGIALTQVGLDQRWGLMRLLYTALALGLFLPLALSAGYGPGITLLFCAQIVLFVALEYLLCFRLVAAEHPLVAFQQALASALAEAQER